MKKHIFMILISLPGLCFAKCGMEKYTLNGVVSVAGDLPLEKVKIEVEWLDFYGKQGSSGLSNKNGAYVVHLNFNKYNGEGRANQTEDICTGVLREIKVTYSSDKLGKSNKTLFVSASELTENFQF